MNKHVCFIGDSHVAALRLALNSENGVKYRPRMDIFGSRGKGLKSIRVENDRIIADDRLVTENFRFTGGEDFIDLHKYQAFCIVGCQGRWAIPENLLGGFSTVRARIDDTPLVSGRFLELLLSERLKQSLAYDVITLLAKATDKPLYYLGNPLVSDEILEHDKGAFLRHIMATNAAEELFSRFNAAIDATFGPYATVIAQPPETIEMPCFTKRTFSQGSVRLSESGPQHPDDDFAHMNADFGTLVLETVFEKIDGQSA